MHPHMMTMGEADDWAGGGHNCPKLEYFLGTKGFGSRKVKSESLVFLKDLVFLKWQSFIMYNLRVVGNHIVMNLGSHSSEKE